MSFSTPSKATPRRLRRLWLERLVLTLVAAIVAETWITAGLFFPVRIQGGSMAPHLMGRHAELRCRECGAVFFCDAERTDRFPRVVCPNCNFVDGPIESPPIALGDRILVDRTAFMIRAPRRWEVAAFRPQDRADQLFVKRIVGLPGEVVSLRDGDVYINGEIRRKDLPVQKSVALLVFDADHTAADVTGAAELHASQWRAVDAELLKEGDTKSQGGVSSIVWREFRHGRAYPPQTAESKRGEWEESPVEDLSSYNPEIPRREETVHAVDDLMLTFRCDRLSAGTGIFILARRRNQEFLISATPGSGASASTQVQIRGNGAVAFEAIVEKPLAGAEWTVSLFDRQLLCAINDEPFFVKQLDEDASTAPVALRPFAIGFQGGESPFWHVRIWRDAYYAASVGAASNGPRRLAADEYFVLGDNSPISEDSRVWKTPGEVVDKYLLGKPLWIIWPFRGREVGRVGFAIPGFSRVGD